MMMMTPRCMSRRTMPMMALMVTVLTVFEHDSYSKAMVTGPTNQLWKARIITPTTVKNVSRSLKPQPYRLRMTTRRVCN